MWYLESGEKALSDNRVVFRQNVEADVLVGHQGNGVTEDAQVVGVGGVREHRVGQSDCLEVK